MLELKKKKPGKKKAYIEALNKTKLYSYNIVKKADARDILASVCKVLIPSLERMTSTLSQIKSNFELSDQSENLLKRQEYLICSFAKDFLFFINDMHKFERFFLTDTYLDYHSNNSSEILDEQGTLQLQNQIEIIYFDDTLYARVPLLFSRYGKSRVSGQNQKFPHYSMLYSDIIRDKMQPILENDLFYEKNVDVVNIYSSDTNLSFVPDADNIDSKATIDAILDAWPGGDGPMCSYSASTITSNRLLSGTYITITKGFQSQPNRQNFEEKLAEIFPNFALH